MKHLFYVCFTVITLIFLTSCQKDEMYISDPNVRYYYNLFKKEADKRGRKLNYSGFNQIVLGGPAYVNSKKVNGYVDFDDKILYLDTTSSMFKTNLEVLLFHELGHGMLARNHRDDLFPCYGPSLIKCYTPRSIMRTGGTFKPDFNEDPYTREYYINELFNEHEPIPDWAK